MGELREKYLEVFGEETRSYHKAFLRRRIVWRLQAGQEGTWAHSEIPHATSVRLS